MDLSDKLSVLSHMANFSILLYIFVATVITGTYEPIHQILTLVGLIFAVVVNIIGVLSTFKKRNNLN